MTLKDPLPDAPTSDSLHEETPPVPIDLDANASTRLDPRVLDRMVEAMHDTWGNASSENALGDAARAAVEAARSEVAAMIGARPQDMLFTSGATESINLALQGIVRNRRREGMPVHLITTPVEHYAVDRTLEQLVNRHRAAVTVLPVDRNGRIDPNDVAAALRPETALVCLIHGNNEIGTINDAAAVGRVLTGHSARLFVDAAQTLGYCTVSVTEANIGLMALSAHKMHGPKGVGALYMGPGIRLDPVMFGGGQERGLRSGTLNTVGIIGFGAAAVLARMEAANRAQYVTRLRGRLLAHLTEMLPDLTLNGHPTERLPSNLSVTIPNVEADALLQRLRGLVAFSRGSACTSSSEGPSHVLRAIGLNGYPLSWTIRLGLSQFNTLAEIDEAADLIGRKAKILRGY